MSPALRRCVALLASSSLIALAFTTFAVPGAVLGCLGVAVLLWHANAQRRVASWVVDCFVVITLANACVLSWMLASLGQGLGFAGAAGVWLFLAAYAALYPTAALGLGAVLVARGCPWTLALPGAWLLAESARAHLFTGFDWLALGNAAIGSPGLAHAYGWIGVHGVSALLVCAAAALVDGLRRYGPLPAVAALVGAMWLLATPLCRDPHDDGTPLRVGVLQTTGDDAELSRYAHDLGRAGAELIAGPEGLLPEHPLILARGVDVIAGRQAPCAVHMGRRCVENTLVHFAASGARDAVYRKQFLVPLYERDIGPFTARGRMYMQPGATPGLFAVRGLWTGGLICYEIMSPDGASALAEAGAQWIVHPTSDTWQLDDRGIRQHVALAQVRAAEFGLPVLRVSNVHSSTLLDPHGRLAWTLPDEATSGLVEISVGGRETFLRRAHALAQAARIAVAVVWLLVAVLFTRKGKRS